MEVKIAEYSGYCFGVRRALELVNRTIESCSHKGKKIYTLGSIINNPGVTDKLSERGLISVKSIEEIKTGSIFIIRSHGMSPDLVEAIKTKKKATIVDTTCPFVKKAQAKAGNMDKMGYFVAIIGNRKHPEVLGIKGHIRDGNYTIIENEEDTEKLDYKKKIGVVIQTTQTGEKLIYITGKLLEKTRELLINNTICDTTIKMQASTRMLARDVDIMIIVGGKDSANTKHLVEISKEINNSTCHVENYRDLKKEWFKNKRKAGLSGGASTPVKDIIDVKEAIEKL